MSGSFYRLWVGFGNKGWLTPVGSPVAENDLPGIGRDHQSPKGVIKGEYLRLYIIYRALPIGAEGVADKQYGGTVRRREINDDLIATVPGNGNAFRGQLD